MSRRQQDFGPAALAGLAIIGVAIWKLLDLLPKGSGIVPGSPRLITPPPAVKRVTPTKVFSTKSPSAKDVPSKAELESALVDPHAMVEDQIRDTFGRVLTTGEFVRRAVDNSRRYRQTIVNVFVGSVSQGKLDEVYQALYSAGLSVRFGAGAQAEVVFRELRELR